MLANRQNDTGCFCGREAVSAPSLAREAAPAATDDAGLRARLLAELEKRSWAPLATIDVVVRNGVVEFFGVITDENERQALIVAAENVPGVKGVRDHLAWLEPTSGAVVQQPEEAAQVS